MILLEVPKLSFSTQLLIPIIISWIVMGVTAVITLFTCKRFNFDKKTTGALMLVSVLTNSSFMGIPIIEAYMGKSALPYIMVYDQFGTFLAFAVYGTFIVSVYTNTHPINLKTMARKIILFPPFITLIIALAFVGIQFNSNITAVLNDLANTIL